MKCPNCGADINENLRFCVNCGVDLKKSNQTDNDDKGKKSEIGEIGESQNKSGGPKNKKKIVFGVVAVSIIAIGGGVYVKSSSDQQAFDKMYQDYKSEDFFQNDDSINSILNIGSEMKKRNQFIVGFNRSKNKEKIKQVDENGKDLILLDETIKKTKKVSDPSFNFKEEEVRHNKIIKLLKGMDDTTKNYAWEKYKYSGDSQNQMMDVLTELNNVAVFPITSKELTIKSDGSLGLDKCTNLLEMLNLSPLKDTEETDFSDYSKWKGQYGLEGFYLALSKYRNELIKVSEEAKAAEESEKKKQEEETNKVAKLSDSELARRVFASSIEVMPGGSENLDIEAVQENAWVDVSNRSEILIKYKRQEYATQSMVELEPNGDFKLSSVQSGGQQESGNIFESNLWHNIRTNIDIKQ